MRALIEQISQKLYANPAWFMLVFVLVYGVGFADIPDFMRLSAEPFSLLPDISRQFLHSSPLIFFLAHPLTIWLGGNASFSITMFGGLLFAFFCARAFIHYHFGSQEKLAASLFLASPLLLIMISWIGKSDPLLIGFFCLLTMSRHWILVLWWSLLMILAHRDLGVVMLVGYALLFRPNYLALALGAAVGLLMIYGYHHYLLLEPPQTRMEFALGSLPIFIRGVAESPLAHIVLMFGPFWLAIVYLLPGISAREIVVFLLALAAACLSLDFTRVFILAAIPLIFYLVKRMVLLKQEPVASQHIDRLLTFLPLLSLLQAQFYSANIVRDSMLLHHLAKLLPL